MSFIKWIGESFNDDKGKPDYSKLTAFALTSVNVYMIVFNRLSEDERLSVYYANLLVISLIVGILTTEHILRFLKK